MVRAFSSTLFLVTLATFGLAFSLPKRDIVQVEEDLAAIEKQVTALDNAVNSFSSTSTLPDALVIHNDAVTLKNTISGATADVQAVPTPVAESDAETILDDVEAFEPTIIDVLSAIVTKKPLFDALPLGGVSTLVASDLVALNSTTWEFGAALIAATPDDLQEKATAIKTAIDSAFSTAIEAYSSS